MTRSIKHLSGNKMEDNEDKNTLQDKNENLVKCIGCGKLFNKKEVTQMEYDYGDLCDRCIELFERIFADKL